MPKIGSIITIVGLAFTIFATGCGGGGNAKVSSSQSIVGTWHRGCYIGKEDADADYATLDITFNKSGKGMLTIESFNDAKCTDFVNKISTKFIYTIGKKTKGSDGQSAVELLLTAYDYDYTMYRFKQNGNLLLAYGEEDRQFPENDESSRNNIFDPNDPGFSRIK